MTNSPVMLITGSRKGIGRYLSEYYAHKGYMVIGCSREPSVLEADNYAHYCVDVSDESGVINMLHDIWSKHARLDVLINNAGISSMNHILLTPTDTVRRIFDVNAIAAFMLCRESAKMMARNKYGRIVNIGSSGVRLGIEGEVAYLASKKAIEEMSHAMARELSAFGITINVVAPMITETDLIRGVPKNKINEVIEKLPIKRMGKMSDISNVIDFYISPNSDYITGQAIYLGGA